jgi:hypothetical protein
LARRSPGSPGCSDSQTTATHRSAGSNGLNTGIGDAVDLGWGAPRLLDSYKAERRPLHRRVIDEATANMATLAPELLDDGLDRPGPDGDRARSAAARRIAQTKRAEYFSTDLVVSAIWPGPAPDHQGETVATAR